MLKELTIKNFALISDLQLRFEQGFTVITGETGAGKSILIEALMAVLGERTGGDVVGKIEEKSVIEARFDVGKHIRIGALLAELELDHFSDDLIIRREILRKGYSRFYVNDTPASAGIVKLLGDELVDFHGQHEHQSLLKPEKHIGLLDMVAETEGDLVEYSRKFKSLQTTVHELKELSRRENELSSAREFVEFQLREIDEIDPLENEDEDIERKLKVIENSERLFTSTSEIEQLLFESESSAHNTLSKSIRQFEFVSSIDPTFTEDLEELRNALVAVKESAQRIRRFSEEVNYQPEELERLNERKHSLQRLIKKYGSLSAALERRSNWTKELVDTTTMEMSKSNLRSSIERLKSELLILAQKVSNARKSSAIWCKKSLEGLLKEMGIPHADFAIDFKFGTIDDPLFCVEGEEFQYQLRSTGIDVVEFFLSTNKGETAKPLSSVASGGEISRVMLALKNLTASRGKLPLLVFDEIDVGISGQIAQKVGSVMKKLAKSHQILAITHLPQVAALGDHHIVVEKKTVGDSTTTTAKSLDIDEHHREVAKLLSGKDVTTSSLASAKELAVLEL